eukprot:g2659.t1
MELRPVNDWGSRPDTMRRTFLPSVSGAARQHQNSGNSGGFGGAPPGGRFDRTGSMPVVIGNRGGGYHTGGAHPMIMGGNNLFREGGGGHQGGYNNQQQMQMNNGGPSQQHGGFDFDHRRVDQHQENIYRNFGGGSRSNSNSRGGRGGRGRYEDEHDRRDGGRSNARGPFDTTMNARSGGFGGPRNGLAPPPPYERMNPAQPRSADPFDRSSRMNQYYNNAFDGTSGGMNNLLNGGAGGRRSRSRERAFQPVRRVEGGGGRGNIDEDAGGASIPYLPGNNSNPPEEKQLQAQAGAKAKASRTSDSANNKDESAVLDTFADMDFLEEVSIVSDDLDAAAEGIANLDQKIAECEENRKNEVERLEAEIEEKEDGEEAERYAVLKEKIVTAIEKEKAKPTVTKPSSKAAAAAVSKTNGGALLTKAKPASVPPVAPPPAKAAETAAAVVGNNAELELMQMLGIDASGANIMPTAAGAGSASSSAQRRERERDGDGDFLKNSTAENYALMKRDEIQEKVAIPKAAPSLLTDVEKMHLELLGATDLSTMTVAPTTAPISRTSMKLSDVLQIRTKMKRKIVERLEEEDGGDLEKKAGGRDDGGNKKASSLKKKTTKAGDRGNRKPKVLKLGTSTAGSKKRPAAEAEDEGEKNAEKKGPPQAKKQKVEPETAAVPKLGVTAQEAELAMMLGLDPDAAARGAILLPKKKSQKPPPPPVDAAAPASSSSAPSSAVEEQKETFVVDPVLAAPGATSARAAGDATMTDKENQVEDRKGAPAGADADGDGTREKLLPDQQEGAQAKRARAPSNDAPPAEGDEKQKAPSEKQEPPKKRLSLLPSHLENPEPKTTSVDENAPTENEDAVDDDTEPDDEDVLLGEDWQIFKLGDRVFYHHQGLRITQWEKPTLKQLKSGLSKPSEPLPVMKYRQEVLNHVKNNRVTIICGETGCGKTTQVPQFLIDDFSIVPKGKYVIVTQPRKIAAVTNSERIASERGHKVVGGEIGYQIRYHNITDDITTRLVFCTTAVVLRRLFEDPGLKRCAALIVDESHERDIHSEFLLTTIKDKLLTPADPKRPDGPSMMGDFKLILMTATFAGSTFVPFFKPLRVKEKDKDPESILQFEGRTYPIKEYYLEDALEWCKSENITLGSLEKLKAVSNRQLEEIDQKLFEHNDTKEYSDTTLRSLAIEASQGVGYISFEKRKLIVEMVRKIDADARRMIKDENGRGSILIFLPGWRDITDLGEALKQSEITDLQVAGQPLEEAFRKYHILPLHSQLIPDEQHQVFDPSPPGRRKIILSTNIAETSVTISDIVYVLNSGIAKEMVFDSQRNTGVLEGQLVSKANNTQRKGRAGRCQEGICIHLFPSYMLDTMKAYQFPEILSNSLEEHILQEMCLKLGDPLEFFKRTVSVPPEDRVINGIEVLENLGAIELAAGEVKEGINRFSWALFWRWKTCRPSRIWLRYQLTDLGQWLGNVPQHPCATLAMSYSAILGVLLPTLAALSFMGQKSPFDIRKEQQAADQDGGRSALGDRFNSDHAALVNAYLGWKHTTYLPEDQKTGRPNPELKKHVQGEAVKYFEQHGLAKELVNGADQNVRSYLNLMVAERGYNGQDCSYRLISPFWTLPRVFTQEKFLLFKLALCMGYCPKFAVLKGSSWYNDQNQELKMSNSSVNSKFSHRMLVEEGKLEAAEQEEPGTTQELLRNSWNNCDPLLLSEKFADTVCYKRKSSSAYFAMYSELMSFGQNKPLQMSETTVVNINTVLLASRTLDFEGHQVQFDGWTAFVEDPEVLEEAKELRKAIRLCMQKAIYNQCMFSVAEQATLVPLLDFLKRDICITDIKGVRVLKASQKDLDSVMLRDLPLDVTQFQLRDMLQGLLSRLTEERRKRIDEGKKREIENIEGRGGLSSRSASKDSEDLVQKQENANNDPEAARIESISIPMGARTGAARGFAFIQFDSRETAKEVAYTSWYLRDKRVSSKLVVDRDPVQGEDVPTVVQGDRGL